MINPNELMIGNYILYKEELGKIQMISDNGDVKLLKNSVVGITVKDIEPLKINEMSCSFKRNIDQKLWSYVLEKGLLLPDDFVYRIIIIFITDYYKFIYSITEVACNSKIEKKYNVLFDSILPIISKIKEVHKVQNLMYNMFGLDPEMEFLKKM